VNPFRSTRRPEIGNHDPPRRLRAGMSDDDDAASSGGAIYRLRRLMSDVAKILKQGLDDKGKRFVDPRCRLRGANGGAVQSDCAGRAIWTGQAATSLVGEGSTNAGIDSSAGDSLAVSLLHQSAKRDFVAGPV
jgi:hypothetical protein